MPGFVVYDHIRAWYSHFMSWESSTSVGDSKTEKWRNVGSSPWVKLFLEWGKSALFMTTFPLSNVLLGQCKSVTDHWDFLHWQVCSNCSKVLQSRVTKHKTEYLSVLETYVVFSFRKNVEKCRFWSRDADAKILNTDWIVL